MACKDCDDKLDVIEQFADKQRELHAELEASRLTNSESMALSESKAMARAARGALRIAKDLNVELRAEVERKESTILDLVAVSMNVSKELLEAEAEVERLAKRDCNATVQLCYSDDGYPFNKEELKIVDVGVSDNVYVVESALSTRLQSENKQLLEKVTELRANIHENGNKAQVIMAGEVLEMRKNTARKCAKIAQDGVTAKYIREEINDKFGLTAEVSHD